MGYRASQYPTAQKYQKKRALGELSLFLSTINTLAAGLYR
jgi:hypothetical protein